MERNNQKIMKKLIISLSVLLIVSVTVNIVLFRESKDWESKCEAHAQASRYEAELINKSIEFAKNVEYSSQALIPISIYYNNRVLERSLEEIIQYTKDYRYEVTDCCNLVREEYDKARIEYTE